jgi:hypothetical protein
MLQKSHRRGPWSALALPLALVATLFASRAEAAVSVKSGDWELTFDGFVNGFAVYEKGHAAPAGAAADPFNSTQDSFRIRTGLLPGLFGFGVVAPKTDDLEVKARIGVYPQINNGNTRDAFGAQQDLRELFFTVDGSFGQVLVGRAINLYQAKNILTDMTLFGVGVQGPVAGGGTTLGRIGYGYLYTQFGAQIRYTTPSAGGLTLAVAAGDPSQICGSAGCASVTKTPAVEAELAFSRKLDGVAVQAWASGLYQQASIAATASVAEQSKTAQGGSAGVGVGVAGFDLLASGFLGKGLGSFFLLDVDALDAAGKERESQGFIGQATYTLGATKLGLSYGQNMMKETSAEKAARTAGGAKGLDTRKSVTGAVYQTVAKHLKVVAEYTRATSEWHGGGSQSADVVSLGGFFLW